MNENDNDNDDEAEAENNNTNDKNDINLSKEKLQPTFLLIFSTFEKWTRHRLKITKRIKEKK